jgi:selenocysteine-specific elongation factor
MSLDPADPAGGVETDVGLVLGTAGHIDHGKTSLVEALTGVDTDRLPEEKKRGITIDLGFAPLDLGDGIRLGVVDVPGHEKLVRTMVAGATGIDLLMLVVAADEGVMPQTREHLAICELLGLDRAVVALTKCDLVEPDLAELAQEEVAALLEETSLAGAPIIPVSSVTGAGLDALREQLVALAKEAHAHTPRTGPPRLAIDRTFEMRGFGSVVTGTLIGSGLSLGDTVEVFPEGPTCKLRGIQRHGASAEYAPPGGRCALNLQNVSLDQLSRGKVISTPGALPRSQTLDVELSWLASAPEGDGPTAVEFLAGTAERRAHVAPIGAEVLEPGAVGFARIHIDGDPVSLLPGDRFVLRGFARTDVGATLGGGRILDVAPPRRRRSDPTLLQELEALVANDPKEDLAVRVARAAFAGAALDTLRIETGLERDAFDNALAALAKEGRVLPAGKRLVVDTETLRAVEARLASSLDAFHEAEPLRPGMPVASLRGALPDNVPREVSDLALSRLAEQGLVRLDGDTARRSDHRATLEGDDAAAAQRICALLADAALEPPSSSDLGERVGVGPDRLATLMGFLEHEGKVVRTKGDLFFDAGAIAALRAKVIAHFDTNDTLDTPSYKALIGTTRRTAVPLMELFDSNHVTVRRGEARYLHHPKG